MEPLLLLLLLDDDDRNLGEFVVLLIRMGDEIEEEENCGSLDLTCSREDDELTMRSLSPSHSSFLFKLKSLTTVD